MNTRRIAQTLELIVGLLAQGRFADLHQLDVAPDLTADDLATCLRQYGGQVCLPPTPQWYYDFYPIIGTDKLAIDCDLFMDGELSDLTLQCVLWDEGVQQVYPFTINSIHVM
ncbi:hypothetical protein GO988_23085 [Hymenobacter sp. HMF4947]|uniref:DUF7668 domain-containing protein n=1 Tax=Hymenobacter ginkgonis TaxID=2682976 RepID=A0A7K1TLC8_9BACT|nr:hypothetical protein [Hymenobacter ginkgonis]MVN79227.1 hypothetical protein [Hymenobacter ginkgonis]